MIKTVSRIQSIISLHREVQISQEPRTRCDDVVPCYCRSLATMYQELPVFSRRKVADARCDVVAPVLSVIRASMLQATVALTPSIEIWRF